MAIEPGAYRSGSGPALWHEDVSYNQPQAMGLINAMRNAYQPELEAQNKALSNLYRRRGLQNSGLYANAMARLGGEQTRALDAGALNIAQFLAQQRENAIGRTYGQHMNILGAKDLQPSEDSGLAGVLGSVAGSFLPIPGGAAVGSAIGSGLANIGRGSTPQTRVRPGTSGTIFSF